MVQGMDFGDTYEILEEIGSGGGGTVYKAFHKRLRTEVALKRIHSNLKNVNSRTETDILKQLKHTFLPQVYDFIENETGVYTVMEFIDGQSLKDYMDQGRVYSEAEVITWFKQLCDALEVLHKKNPPIIHGDIKPANIMLTKEGNVCLIDFNIASIFAGTKTIISGYTPGFAAPEQVEYYQKMKNANKAKQLGASADEKLEFEATEISEDEDSRTELDEDILKNQSIGGWDTDTLRSVVDARTDIFSLGATVFYLLSGKKPRKPDGTLTNIREVCPNISEALAHIIDGCIADNPQNRYQSVGDIKKALDNVYLSHARYKKLVAQQNAARALMYVGMVVFGFMAVFGFKLMQRDSAEAYQKYVAQIAEAASANDAESVEDAYQDAVALNAVSADAYIEKAKYLYNAHKYQEAEGFLADAAIPYVKDSVGRSNLYLLLGNCLMAEEQYETAITIFTEALKENDDNAEIYRDFAICYIKLHETSKAEKLISKSVEKGLDEAGVCYINAEIAFAKKNYEEARKLYLDAIDATNDSYTKLRAYLMIFEIDDEIGTEEALLSKIQLAEEAEKKVDGNSLISIWEEKTQTYISLANLTGDKSYNDKAVEICEKIINSGYASFRTHQTMAALLLSSGRLEEEEKELGLMLEQYGDDYRTYMYYAYLEAAKQNQLDNVSRDYRKFEEYYKKAIEFYETANQADVEMQNLMSLYQQVCDQNWLD